MNIKQKMKQGRVRATVLSMLVAVIIVVFVTGCSGISGNVIPYDSEQEVYDYFAEAPDTEYDYSTDKYGKIIEEERKGYYDYIDQLGDIKTAAELPSSFDALVEESNELICEYFDEKYSVSVEDKLAQMKLKKIDGCDESIMGFQESNTPGYPSDTVFISSSYLDSIVDPDSSSTEFMMVYLHETVHYLGVNNTDQGISYLLEGITEALAEDMMQYGGYDYFNTSAYVNNTYLGKQFIIADKDFVRDIIASDHYYTTEEWTRAIDSCSVEGMTELLDDSMLLTMSNPDDKNYREIAQYFMGEYCKYFELTDEEQIKIADQFLVPVSKLAD